MDRFKAFIQTVFLGGVVVLLPIVILILVFSVIIKFATVFAVAPLRVSPAGCAQTVPKELSAFIGGRRTCTGAIDFSTTHYLRQCPASPSLTGVVEYRH